MWGLGFRVNYPEPYASNPFEDVFLFWGLRPASPELGKARNQEVLGLSLEFTV